MKNSERIQRELLKKRFLSAAWNLCGFAIPAESVTTIKRGFELVQSRRYDMAEEVMMADKLAAQIWKEAQG